MVTVEVKPFELRGLHSDTYLWCVALIRTPKQEAVIVGGGAVLRTVNIVTPLATNYEKHSPYSIPGLQETVSDSTTCSQCQPQQKHLLLCEKHNCRDALFHGPWALQCAQSVSVL